MPQRLVKTGRHPLPWTTFQGSVPKAQAGGLQIGPTSTSPHWTMAGFMQVEHWMWTGAISKLALLPCPALWLLPLPTYQTKFIQLPVHTNPSWWTIATVHLMISSLHSCRWVLERPRKAGHPLWPKLGLVFYLIQSSAHSCQSHGAPGCQTQGFRGHPGGKSVDWRKGKGMWEHRGVFESDPPYQVPQEESQAHL